MPVSGSSTVFLFKIKQTNIVFVDWCYGDVFFFFLQSSEPGALGEMGEEGEIGETVMLLYGFYLTTFKNELRYGWRILKCFLFTLRFVFRYQSNPNCSIRSPTRHPLDFL